MEEEQTPYFVHDVLERIAGFFDNTESNIEVINTWGDETYIYIKARRTSSQNPKQLEVTGAWHGLRDLRKTFKTCAKSNYNLQKSIDFLSTPFDNDAVDMLDNIMPFFKIADVYSESV